MPPGTFSLRLEVYLGSLTPLQVGGLALAGFVTRGAIPFQVVLGTDYWTYLRTHPGAGDTFNAAMATMRVQWDRLPEVYDFRPHRQLVDVGGGEGSLIATVLRATPDLRGTLLELPHVAARARDYLRAQGLTDRCEVVDGDGMAVIPPRGDVFVMSTLLRNFADEDAGRILANCRHAFDRDGRLLIVEGVIREAGSSPVLARDLVILTIGEMERTEAEWRELVRTADFAVDRWVTLTPSFDVIVCRPMAGTTAR